MYIDGGADVNRRSDTGNTALHYLFDHYDKLPTTPVARRMAIQSCT